ncbi:MAG: hypothetical protein B6U72_06190 [Candidatus Altiarchaeales archaeon ex4484_2]|nr:MAG: hypothetical protein B6U72_06190 [Candidatus Altiarchaeales archaeon ex4484_2]
MVHSAREMKLDYKTAFKYPLKDWKRLVVMGLLDFPGAFLLLPIPFYIGYVIKTAEELLEGNNKLPEIKDPIYLLKKGLGAIAVAIEFSLTTLFLTISFIIGTTLGLYLLSTLLLNQPPTALMRLIGYILFMIGSVYIILSLPLMMIHYARKNKFTAGFDIMEPYATFKKEKKKFIIAATIMLVLNFLQYFAIIILPLYGVVIAYTELITLHLYTQLYKNKEKIEQTI